MLPCLHAILYTYTLKQTITGNINAEFKEILKKYFCFWNLPFFNGHFNVPVPSATWNLQSVFLLPEPSILLVHQSSGTSSPPSLLQDQFFKMVPQANGWELFLTICWGFLSQKCTTKTLPFKELFCLFVCLCSKSEKLLCWTHTHALAEQIPFHRVFQGSVHCSASKGPSPSSTK